MNRNLENVKQPLTDLKEFWLAIFIPSGVCLVLMIWISISNDLQFSSDYKDIYKTLTEIFVLPLSVLGTMIPAVTWVSINHRSKQTVAQIKEAEQINTMNAYYKHQEAFVKEFKILNFSYLDDNDLDRENYIAMLPHMHRLWYGLNYQEFEYGSILKDVIIKLDDNLNMSYNIGFKNRKTPTKDELFDIYVTFQFMFPRYSALGNNDSIKGTIIYLEIISRMLMGEDLVEDVFQNLNSKLNFLLYCMRNEIKSEKELDDIKE